MTDGKEPRNAIHGCPEIVTTPRIRRADVECCPNAQSTDGGEILGRERTLEVERGGNRGVAPGERDAKSVTDRLEDVTTVRSDGRAPDCVVALHRRRHRLAMRVPALCAPLNICVKRNVTVPVVGNTPSRGAGARETLAIVCDSASIPSDPG